MRLPKFECLYPQTLQEATAQLARHKGEARIMAGGTDIVVAMKQRRAIPKYLINIKSITDLSHIAYDQTAGLSIGALATLDEIANSNAISGRYPSLSQAASRAATQQIRNVGTIGGNIALDSRCWYYNQSESWRSVRPACFKTGGRSCYVVKGGKQCYSLISADTVPALMTLAASVEVVGSSGPRTISISKLYTGIGQNHIVIGRDEIITRVILPPPTGRGVYLKYAYRESIDFPLVGVAVSLSDTRNEAINDIRIVVGAASPAPVRAVQAEKILEGQVLNDELLNNAGLAAISDVTPIVYLFAPVVLKRKMVEILVKRAIKKAVE